MQATDFDGDGNFFKTPILQSGLFVPGKAKTVVALRNKLGNALVAASQSRGAFKVVAVKKDTKQTPALYDDMAALIILANNKTQRQELNYGSSFFVSIGPVYNYAARCQTCCYY